MKKTLAIIMVIIMLVALPITVYAGTYILNKNCVLNISGGGLAGCSASMSCSASVDKTRVSCYLQRDDGGWQTVKHWSKTTYSNFISWSGSRYVTSGYNYRLRVYYYAYIDDSVVESASLSSYEYY